MKVTYMFAYGLVLNLIGCVIVAYDFNITGLRNTYTVWTCFVGMPLMIMGGAFMLISHCTDKKKLRVINE